MLNVCETFTTGGMNVNKLHGMVVKLLEKMELVHTIYFFFLTAG